MLFQKDIENRSRTDESFSKVSDIPPFAPPTRSAVDCDLHNCGLLLIVDFRLLPTGAAHHRVDNKWRAAQDSRCNDIEV